MSMFDSVYLEDFDFILEGKQVEEYNARKAKEKEDRDKREKFRDDHRYGKNIIDTETDDYYGLKKKERILKNPVGDKESGSKKDIERKEKAYKMVDNAKRGNNPKIHDNDHTEYHSSWGNPTKAEHDDRGTLKAVDAANRYLRNKERKEKKKKTPKQESAEILLSTYEPEYYY